jgi:hypothetical protein
MLSIRHASLLAAALATATLGLSTREAAAQTSPPPPPPPPPPPAATTPPPAETKPPAPKPNFVSLTDPGPPEAPPVAARPAPLATSTARAPLEPEPEPATNDLHPTAFRADFKLPFTVASLASGSGGSSALPIAVPQLILGFQSGRWGLGAGIGFTTVSESAGEFSSTENAAEVLIAPTLTVDAFQSKDGKAALYFLGAPIFGIIVGSNQSAESDLGFQFAVGANYALHENFHIGLEVGPVGHFYSGNEGASESVVSIYTALVGTFVYPR